MLESASAPMGFDMAVWAFAGVAAVGGWNKLNNMDRKMSQLLTTLHGAPEQNGNGGVMAQLREHNARIATLAADVTELAARVRSLDRRVYTHPAGDPDLNDGK